MKPRALAVLATWALLMALGLPTAAAAQERATRSALIVGVSRYAAPEVPPLAGVVQDMGSARAIAQAMGIPEAQTTVLRDEQATKAAVLQALEDLAARIGEGSRVFVYFSGHGTRWYEPSRGGCREGLLSYDRQPITNDEIAQRTRRISALADKVVVLFDACHSDGVSTLAGRTRSLASGALTAKFFLKDGADAQACARPSNVPSRALLAEATRLGALRENFVQITSSRADEASFDEADRGGIATQSLRDCLLGRAVDLDASGAVSMAELQQCAQAIVERKLKPYAELRPQHISVSGNRNLVPAPATPPSAVASAPAPVAVTASAPATTQPAVLASPPSTPVSPIPPATPIFAPAPVPVALPVAPALASLATLRDIEAQRNPRRSVTVTLNRPTLRIGRDELRLTVRAGHAGYVYLVMLGSDRESFYLLFPNALDRSNAIAAGTEMTLPRADWRIQARGPAGSDKLLVLVSDTPRDLSALTPRPAGAKTPFVFALNDLAGRSALIDFFTGRGVTGRSESFGATLMSIQEMP